MPAETLEMEHVREVSLKDLRQPPVLLELTKSLKR